MALKDVIISPEIRGDSALAPAVERAVEILDEEVGRSAPQVAAQWTRDTDRLGRAVLVLRLEDWTGSVEDRFAREDLADDWSLRRRLGRLWGELLRQGSYRQLERLHQTVQELEGDEG